MITSSTHLLSDTYERVPGRPGVGKIYFRCQGRTDECRGKCLVPLSPCWTKRDNNSCGCGRVQDSHRLQCLCLPHTEQSAKHFQCGWQLKLEFNFNLTHADVFQDEKNPEYHRHIPTESKIHMLQSDKIHIDEGRVRNHLTPSSYLDGTPPHTLMH